MSLIEAFKKEFADRDGIHFNNAGMAPISNRVAQRLTTCVTELQHQGSLVDPRWVPQIKIARDRIAQFLDADPSEVALSQNCAMALSQAALGFPLSPGDQVVVLDQEYASNFYPWQVACARSGADLVVLKSKSNLQIDLQEMKAAISTRVKIVAVSWVQFQTGASIDLQKLGEHCHSVGAFLVVDGIQGLGQLPFSFRQLPVDFIAGGSHKWNCGINGQGYFAVKPQLMAKLSPIAVGSGTFNRFGTYADEAAEMERTARRFEPGGLGYLPLFALDEALALISETGVDVIAAEISQLSKILREGLSQIEAVELVTPIDQIGGITSFKLPFAIEAKFLRACREQQFALVKRGEFIRIAIHAFNEEDEVARVLNCLGSI